jgi:hypothetical protein
MFDILRISKEIIKRNGKLFSGLTLITFSIAIYNLLTTELVFEANYTGAPYYETASDVTFKVKELCAAINDNDQEYINKYVGDSLDVKDLTNALGKKLQHSSDYTFKHIKVKLSVDVLDSTNLSLWDKKIHQFYLNASNNKDNLYRGREVYKERISILAEKQYGYDVSDKNDSLKYLNILKFYLGQDSLNISDSNMVDLVFARYIAEYRNSISVNQITTLTSSHHLKKEQILLFSSFIYTSIAPLFILLFFWTSYLDYKQSKGLKQKEE